MQLVRLGLLHKFITGIAFRSDDWKLKVLPSPWRRKLSNRILPPGIKPGQLSTQLMTESSSLLRIKLGYQPEAALRTRNRKFQISIRPVEWLSADVLIGFDTSSWLMIQRARKQGIPYVLDQSIAHPLLKEKVYQELRERYPDWNHDMVPKDGAAIEDEQREHNEATCIVVASSFTRKSLVDFGVSPDKIKVNPYGVSENFFIQSGPKKHTKVRWLFLGLLGARKGLPFLLEVWVKFRLFEYAELWLAGPADDFALKAINGIPGVEYRGRLAGKDVPALLSNCDGLLFPSFFEGFGQVILEAMAAGLPVVTTEATAGPDIIESGKDGYIVAAGHVEEWGRLLSELSGRREHLIQMGYRAVEKARMFTWEAYGNRWQEILKEVTREV